MFNRKKKASMRFLGATALLEERKYLFFQRSVIIFCLGAMTIFLFWADATLLHEIAMAKGQLVPQKGVVPIQHRFGGEIMELLVSQGQQVTAGESLLKLRDSSVFSEKKRAQLQLRSTLASKRYFDLEYDKRKQLVEQGLASQLPFLAIQAKKKELEGKIADLKEIVKSFKVQLKSLEIKAPISGYIHGLSITKAGVIKPGTTIMEIVPIDEPMVAEVEISPSDIGHVKAGQSVKIKVDSFDFNRYGAVMGRLKEVSPTTYTSRDGQPYYRGYVDFSGVSQLPFGPLMPGMTILADIHTGDKSVLEYLLKPIFSSAQQALRER